MLAPGRNQLHGAARDRRVLMHARERRERRFEAGDDLSGEGAMERTRRAEDGVAFRHLGLRPPHHESHGGRVEAGLDEKWSEGMIPGRDAADFGDDEAPEA